MKFSIVLSYLITFAKLNHTNMLARIRISIVIFKLLYYITDNQLFTPPPMPE
jgi:hypothetical protein